MYFHYAANWFCVAVVFIKRRASDVTAGWDDKIDDAPLNTMIKEVLTRMRKEDPAQGRWCVDGQTLSVWVDASSLATGVLFVYDGAVVGMLVGFDQQRTPNILTLQNLMLLLKE